MKHASIREYPQTNATLATIYTRRAVRKYQPTAVDRQQVEQLIGAARMAPSAMNRQPWKFYVVSNAELIHLLSKDIVKKAFKEEVKKGFKGILASASALLHALHNFDLSRFDDPIFYKAPVVIFITAPLNNEWAPLDIGMCAQNMMLAAKSLGLDTCPVGFAQFVNHTEHYARLGIPEDEKVLLAVIVGYGNETPPVHERVTNNVMYIE